MEKSFVMKLAETPIKVFYRRDYVANFCKDYICDENEKIIASTTEAEVLNELSLVPGATAESAEVLCLYRTIAEQLPALKKAVFHGAAISYGGKAYIFTAPSTTGKTTHIKLWRKFIGEKVGIINGDKPIISLDGVPTVFGTPWAGKEGWQKNTSAPIGAITIIKRGTDNKTEKLSPEKAVSALMNQIYIPKDPVALAATLGILNDILAKVPVYLLSCDMSEQAVKSSFEALTGEKYKKQA